MREICNLWYAGSPDAGCGGGDGDCDDLPDRQRHPVHLPHHDHGDGDDIRSPRSSQDDLKFLLDIPVYILPPCPHIHMMHKTVKDIKL